MHQLYASLRLVRRPYTFLLLLCCLLAGSLPAWSQDEARYRDSLQHLLRTAPADTSKVGIYLKYGEIYEMSRPDSATFYYNQARDLAERLRFSKGYATWVSYYIVILNNKGRYDEALDLCRKAVRIYDSLGRRRDEAIALNNISHEYQNLGLFKLAVEAQLESIRMITEVGDQYLLRMYTNNLGAIFINLQEFAKGYDYALRSYRIATAINDTFSLASSLINVASAEMYLKKYEPAAQHFREAAKYGHLLDDYTLVLDATVNLGMIDCYRGQYASAIERFRYALEEGQRYENPAYTLLGYRGLMDVAMTMRDWKEADKYGGEAIRIARELNAGNELNELCYKAAEVKEQLGDLAGALAYRKEFERLNDTLLGVKTRNEIHQQEIRYQTAEKDRSLAEQRLQLERNRSSMRRKDNLLTVLGGGIAALVAIGVLSYRFYRQRQSLQRQRILTLQNEQQLIRLRATMEGQNQERRRISGEMHDDIGSGLTTILYLSENLSRQNGQGETAGRIRGIAGSLVEKMNEIIWSMNQDYDSLEDLVAYIRLQAGELLDNHDIAWHFDIPDEVPALHLAGEQRRNMYLAIKESLHNIIKHAGATEVTLQFRFDPELCVVIRDNGKGIALEELRRFGNGLRNMQERMSRAGGHFDIQSGEGTTVTLSMPFVL